MSTLSKTSDVRTNVPEFSVSDLAMSMKRTLEDNYGRVRVRGELSRVSIAGSGHMYSSLKDDGAVIDAVCWKGTMAKLSVRPEEGMEVICVGRITTYPKSSKYQLVIESLELAGEGALLKMLEDRKKKLAAEGLFAAERKSPLPFLPRTIGVVTSPTGAVIRDILHRLSDRFPRHVLVWPVVVQGDKAADQIAAAITGFQNIDKHGLPRPDLIIVARGGGSLEDLMAFNEENVVRAVAASTIPLISAVGHETDTTLIDYVSDLRAPTPTAAAEHAVPVRAELLAQILDDERRLVNGVSRLMAENTHRLEAMSRGLGDPVQILEVKSQAFDHLSDKIAHVFKHYLSGKNERLIQTGARLSTPAHRLSQAGQMLERWSDQLSAVPEKLVEPLDKRLENLGRMLEAYSFENVLSRGFSVIRTPEGALISRAAQTKAGQNIVIQFQKQEKVSALVQPVDGSAPPPPKMPKPSKPKSPQKPPPNINQQSLF